MTVTGVFPGRAPRHAAPAAGRRHGTPVAVRPDETPAGALRHGTSVEAAVHHAERAQPERLRGRAWDDVASDAARP